MKLSEWKSRAAQEALLSDHIPFTHLCSPSIFATKGGMLGMILGIKGFPFVTASNSELNAYQQLLHQALLKLNHEFIVYETRVRTRQNTRLDGQFHSDFARRVNDKYQQRFNDSALYRNEIYWTLIYKNHELSGGKERLFDKILRIGRKLSDQHVLSNVQERRIEGMAKLRHKFSEIQSLLSGAGVHVLGEQDDQLGYSELLAFLSLIPNGGQRQTLHPSMQANPVAKNFKQLGDARQRYPQGNLAQYLCNKRVFLGAAIQFQGNSRQDKRFAAMLSLKQYNADSANVVLDPLMNLDGEYILTQSFAPLEQDMAIKEIARAHAMKVNAEDMSASQIDELGTLADLVSSQKLSCGFHHNSLMLLADDPASLDKLDHQASKAYAQANMGLVRETLAQIPAFFAQLPGNAHHIPRAALITSENMADFCSLHNTQSGHHQQNFLPSAVSLLETPSRTPVYFNYHVKGSKTNPSKGHALIIGGNDSGKTTLVSFLDSQMARFENHRAVFLDRNNGLKIYIKAMGGQYITIAPTHKHECQMNPLALPDTSFNRDFCKSWLAALLVQADELQLPGNIAEITNEAVDYCFETLNPSERTLSNLARFLPIDFPRWPELKRWLKSNDDRSEGQYGWLFDNSEDTLHLDSRRIGFDVTYVLDNFPPDIACPLFMYVMHRIELCLDGHLTSIAVDEMWQVLRTPYWRGWLEERLPSIRKDYGHIIGMTQSPKTIVDSPISAELLDNMATLILFPNPKAEKGVYIERLGLSMAEYEFIKNNSPQSRLFLYKHDTESMICRLDLSNLSDEIRVFSANKVSVNLMESIIKERGDAPELWLNEFIQRSKL